MVACAASLLLSGFGVRVCVCVCVFDVCRFLHIVNCLMLFVAVVIDVVTIARSNFLCLCVVAVVCLYACW